MKGKIMQQWLRLMAATLATVLALNVAAETLVEGSHYKVVNPVGKTTEPVVVEVFSYGCSHCYQFEGFVHDWQSTKPKNIKFERIPAVGMQPAWDIYAKAYYTAEALGVLEQMNAPLYARIHVDRKPIRDDEELVAFLKGFGKDEKLIRDTMNGFFVDTKMRAAKEYMKKYRIPGTPAFVINEKYMTDGSMAKGFDTLKQILNELPLKK